MKLSDIIKNIQDVIDTFGDYELDNGAIYTDNVEIEASRINKFDIVVDEKSGTATIELMS